MKINDVVTLMEFGFGPPGSRAMGTGNFALLHRAYVHGKDKNKIKKHGNSPS